MSATALPTLVLIALLAAASLLLYTHLARRWGLLAEADSDRHLHQGRVPTGAGLAFLWPLLIVLPWLMSLPGTAHDFLPGLTDFPEKQFYAIATLGLLVLFFTGYLDDRRHLPARWRLLIQIILVSGLLVLLWPPLQSHGFGRWWLPVFFLGALWWLNLFNFMDGANGMAAWHVVVTTGFYALVFYLHGALKPAFLSAAVALVSAVFLRWNFPRARFFMGDTGSLSLAWLILLLALAGLTTGAFDPTFVLLLHLPFVLDSTYTLWVRWRGGQRLTEAHRQHLYQRLITSGQTHARVALGYALASLVGGLLALASFSLPETGRWLILLVWLVLLLMVGTFLNQTTKIKPSA